MSPRTKRTCASAAGSPRAITNSTPASDSTAPAIWRRVGCSLCISEPTAIIQTGELAAISVTLIGVVVTSARYCNAL